MRIRRRQRTAEAGLSAVRIRLQGARGRQMGGRRPHPHAGLPRQDGGLVVFLARRHRVVPALASARPRLQRLGKPRRTANTSAPPISCTNISPARMARSTNCGSTSTTRPRPSTPSVQGLRSARGLRAARPARGARSRRPHDPLRARHRLRLRNALALLARHDRPPRSDASHCRRPRSARCAPRS